MSKKYRKKPVVIDAIQYDGSYQSFIDIINEFEIKSNFIQGSFSIPTLEGDMKASSGDYIIKGIKGECYPCKPDIFKASYEAVE